MRYLSVCSGIESATVAWHGLGWQPVGFSEIEPFPSAVLAHHYPTVPNYGDMTKHETWPITPGTVDLLVGGTPCQSFSVAGLRQGLADPRGNLTLVYLAMVARLRPKWVVWENVPGVLSDSTGAFGAFLGGLGQLGYGWTYRILDAQHFGVPQRRRRVFVVGHSGGAWQRAAAVLFEPESLRGDRPPSRGTGQGVAGIAVKGAAIGRKPSAGPQYGECLSDGSMYTLNCTEVHAVLPPIAHALTSRHDNSEDGSGRGTPLVAVAYGFQPRIARNGRGDMGETCDTLSAQAGGTGKGDSAPCVATQCGVRRIMPIECERLQGFPDNHTLVPYRGKPACDGPRYKALGNSMAVPCMRWIGERLAAVDKIPATPCTRT